jgi:hypothetical protein
MPITISGSTGISGVDGSSATPALQGTDTNTGISYGTDIVTINTGGTARVTTDASGNVGLGATPSAWNVLFKVFEIGTAASFVGTFNSADIYMAFNGYFDTSWKYKTSNFATRYVQGNGAHTWFNAPSGTAGNAISFTQAMTLDASGNLLVGTTATIGNGKISVKGNVNLTAIGVQVGADGNYGIQFQNAANSNAGFIQVNTSSTNYSTSSDYRLKENVTPMTGALEKIAALKPCTYTWKADGSAGQGFIAHELQAVVPDCVTGKKDAIETIDDLDAEGRKIGTKEVPRYQGVDTSFLVATLVAAIQELKTEVDALKAG